MQSSLASYSGRDKVHLTESIQSAATMSTEDGKEKQLRSDFSFMVDFKKPRTHARKAIELKRHIINVL